MAVRRIAAILYTIATVVVVGFQIALALGAPWGEFAMGGAYPGQFPPPLRVAAVIQALLLLGFMLVVLGQAGLISLPGRLASRWLLWVVVVFSAVSLVLNLITPSTGERAIWAPVALVMLVGSGVVAFMKPS